jgi:hypothetical protein
MKLIFTAVEYNNNCPSARRALLPNGEIRETDYVLVCEETDTATWFPNKQQARQERIEPGRFGQRGVKL